MRAWSHLRESTPSQMGRALREFAEVVIVGLAFNVEGRKPTFLVPGMDRE
jgi:hypothetical protein